jgi:hypothetical protein
VGELWNEAIASELRASLSAEYNYEQGTYVITREEAMCAIVPALDALAGLNPDALAELIAACDDLALLLDGKPSLFHQSLSNTLRAALAKLRGTGGGE